MPTKVELNDVEEKVLKQFKDRMHDFNGFIRPTHEQWNDEYRQYRIVRAARAHYKANPPDRDQTAAELADHFDRDVHVPIAYGTIETLVPRTVAALPKGRVMPDERGADENVQNMQILCEQQHGFMAFSLLSQEIIKSEFLYGLGVVKGPYWKRVVQPGMPYLERATSANISGSPWVEATRDRVVIDNAWGEKVDVFDCAWDPFGYDRHTLRWFASRSWRDHEYVADQLGLTPGAEIADRSKAVWNTEAAQQLTAEDIEGMAIGKKQMDGVWKDRMTSAGHGSADIREGLHEVWEMWNTRGEVWVILDGEYPVRIAKNPFWHGQLPYHFGRPQTQGINTLHGISEIEPMSDQIRELDLIRTLRSKNAMLALMRVLIFDEDAVDRDDLELGPGTAIPVRSDDPRQHLYALEIPDIPFATYREEEQIKGDLDRSSGISDVVTGAAAGGTATEANLVQAAAGVRIQNKTERFEDEVATPFINQQITLNQQMVIEKDVRVPKQPEPGQIDPRGWEWLTLTPAELSGMMSYAIDRNSMGPRNAQQEAIQGQQVFAALQQNPRIDQEWLLKHYLESQGVKNPSARVLPQPQVPPGFMQAVAKVYGEDAVQRLMALSQGGEDGS